MEFPNVVCMGVAETETLVARPAAGVIARHHPLAMIRGLLVPELFHANSFHEPFGFAPLNTEKKVAAPAGAAAENVEGAAGAGAGAEGSSVSPLLYAAGPYDPGDSVPPLGTGVEPSLNMYVPEFAPEPARDMNSNERPSGDCSSSRRPPVFVSENPSNCTETVETEFAIEGVASGAPTLMIEG